MVELENFAMMKWKLNDIPAPREAEFLVVDSAMQSYSSFFYQRRWEINFDSRNSPELNEKFQIQAAMTHHMLHQCQ